ncbi:MAG: AAA family ATPase [Thermoleophilia bacterium]
MTDNQQATNVARKNGHGEDEFTELGATFRRLHANICRVIVGKDDIVRMVLTALISRGHVLLEDIPGVGKTTLAKCIARSISATWARIQFTPDLLPSDITGSTVYSPKDERFYWSPGPIFANIVLADEINRTSPRTQSALLEAMEEQQVTVDRATHPLPQPFFVIATQNPHELHGTFPLPESQKDRFLISLSIGLPNRVSEQKLVRDQLVTHPLQELEPVIDAQEVTALQAAVRRVTVAENVLAYALDITAATRSHEAVSTGASPRASVSLVHTCQGIAFTEGRTYVIPDDVQRAAVPVLAHRLLLGRGTVQRHTDAADVIRDVLASHRVPV